MLTMTGLALDHEIAHRHHELERAARREAVVRYRNTRQDRRRTSAGATRMAWWRRLILAH